jgi:hypothetical protein
LCCDILSTGLSSLQGEGGLVVLMVDSQGCEITCPVGGLSWVPSGTVRHFRWTALARGHGVDGPRLAREERKTLVLLRLLRNIQVQPAFCGGVTGSFAVLLRFVQPACERRSRSMCARYLRSETRDNLCDQCQVTRKPTAASHYSRFVCRRHSLPHLLLHNKPELRASLGSPIILSPKEHWW